MSIHPQERRRTTLADECFDDGDDLVGGSVPATRIARESQLNFSTMVEQLQPALIHGLIEMEVQRPHMVGPRRAQQVPSGTSAATLALGRNRTPVAFFENKNAGSTYFEFWRRQLERLLR